MDIITGYCDMCRAELTAEAERLYTRPCARCGQPLIAGSAKELFGTTYRANLSKTLCPTCHSSDPKVIARGLAVQLARARERGQAATLTAEEWQATLKYFGYQCAYCAQRPYPPSDPAARLTFWEWWLAEAAPAAHAAASE